MWVRWGTEGDVDGYRFCIIAKSRAKGVQGTVRRK